jgi:hypothetical protein
MLKNDLRGEHLDLSGMKHQEAEKSCIILMPTLAKYYQNVQIKEHEGMQHALRRT